MTYDGPTGAGIGIDQEHHEIHEGNTYIASYKSPDGSDVADNGTVAFGFRTGSTYCHVAANGACGGDMEGEFREGCTLAGGTAMNIFNKNRGKVARQQATVVRGPTVSDAGTLLENRLVPGGTGPMSVGGAGSQRVEWVCAPNTTYLFRITNRSGGAQPMSLVLEWYELGGNE